MGLSDASLALSGSARRVHGRTRTQSILEPIAVQSIPVPTSQTDRGVRIVIACNETIIRQSIQMVLQVAGGFEVVGGCSDSEGALRLLRTLSPDILLLDYRLPHNGWMSMLEQLQRSTPNIKVVLLCGALTQDETIRALHAGVRGIVMKSEPTEALIECVGKVVQDEYWLGKTGVSELVSALLDLKYTNARSEGRFGLTAREIQIVEAVMEGYANDEIAAKFSISEQTVKHHLSHIFDKLGVFSRLELALFGVNHDIHS